MSLRRWVVALQRRSTDWERNQTFAAEPKRIVKRCWTKRGADRYAYKRFLRPSALRSRYRGEDSRVWFESWEAGAAVYRAREIAR